MELAAKFNNLQNSLNNPPTDISIGVPTTNLTSEKSPIQNFTRNSINRGSVRLREIGVIGRGDKKPNETAAMTQSMSGEVETSRGQPLARVPSAPGSLRLIFFVLHPVFNISVLFIFFISKCFGTL